MMHPGEKKKEARELYIRSGVRNLTHLERLTDISRVTLRKWRDDDEWDKTVSALDVDPQEIMKMYLRIELKLLKEIEQKEIAGEVPADTTLKRQNFYRKMARDIDAQFDIAGTVLRFAEQFIDFISGIPDFEGKTAFIAQLSDQLPKFMDYVIHGKLGK